MSRQRLFCFCGLGLSVLLGFGSFALAAPDLRIGSAHGAPGQGVEVAVDFTGNGAAVALLFEISFDPAALAPGTAKAEPALGAHEILAHSSAPGRLKVFLRPPVSAPLAPLRSGRLLRLPFAISAAASLGPRPLVLSGVLLSDSAARSVTAARLGDGQIIIGAPLGSGTGWLVALLVLFTAGRRASKPLTTSGSAGALGGP